MSGVCVGGGGKGGGGRRVGAETPRFLSSRQRLSFSCVPAKNL